jgi:superfamily I DNA/RNA helicase
VPRLAIDKDFMGDFSKLEKSVQYSVMEIFEKFAEHTHAGLHLEKLQHPKDDRVRTIRIDINWRGVVLAPEAGDTYCLLKVLPHEKAYAYARSRKFTVNQALGVIDVHDEAAREEAQPALEQAAASTGQRLLAHVSDGDLSRLGIDANTLTIARLLPSEAHLEALQAMIPEVQYIALLGLAAGQTPEEVWAEILQYAPADPSDTIDTGDITRAMRRTPSKVLFVEDSEDLKRILQHPFAAWRTFLHPAQRKIAYAPKFAGPVQVTGGAGTGKTVTALHRAAHLARQALGQLPTDGGAKPPILITTYTKNLADALDAQFSLLTELSDAETARDLRGQVEILNVDRLAYQVVSRSRGGSLAPIDDRDLLDIWTAAAEKAGAPFSPAFLNREWRQVILAQGLSGEDAYLTCSRAGQGTPLGKAQRRQVWQVTQQVEAELRSQGRDTFLQLAEEAARVLREAPAPPYRHVIVDEAQDLHPAQWRLLRAAVAAGTDDLFIVGDPHQRIYGNTVSLAKLAINVRGRSRRLTVNYRTTQEILALAVRTLGMGPISGLDDEADTLDGYRSPRNGRRPKVIPARTREAEMAALVKQVQAWLDDGIEPHAIGVAARSGHMHKAASTELAKTGIPTVSLSAKSSKNAVRVGTMHGMKGLEFQAVAVIGVSEGIVPAPNAVTPESEDPLTHAQDLQRERCLLFVACTRARDYLYVSYSGNPSPFLAGS